MSELSGTLEGVGLPAILHFLGGLKKTGCLSVVQEGWAGEIFFVSGDVTNAAFGSRHGLQALDALVETLPRASFVFDSEAAQPASRDVTLATDALYQHLDELVADDRNGAPHLPSLDAVPTVVEQPDSGPGEEPLPLDRGTLQTLLAVNGERTVREIISQRGSFDALWQLANLINVGLVRMSAGAGSGTTVVPAPTPTEGVPVGRPAASNVRPIGVEVVDAPLEAVRCPKLGFEDDPASSFGRPTRLHRCFAAGTPLPLSLDQQRELCISEQFGTCPRLALVTGGSSSSSSSSRPTNPTPPAPSGFTPETDDPRIVRLPVGGRNAAAARESVADRPAVGGADPARFRTSTSGGPPRDGGTRPTPLRSRMQRPARTASVAGAASEPPQASASAVPSRSPLVDEVDRRVMGVPVQALAAGLVIVIVIAAVGFLLAPHVGDLFSDEPSDVDLAALPNSSALVAGTPIAQITSAPTPVQVAAARASAVPAGQSGASPSGTSPSGASAANAPARPTLPPEPTPAPTPLPTGAPPSEPVAAAAANVLLDERFATNAGWPSSTNGTAVFTNGSYRVIPRAVGQFVAIGAPMTTPLQDAVVSATFHKVSGPPGGGYGIIVRDQSTTPQNGTTQNGRYYVLEVGDVGQVGMWRRDNDQWVDLLPWQKADAVKPGTATNDVTVRTVGNTLTMLVNGTEVATRTDDALARGLVGVFVGGDGNQVSVDRFTVQAL